ncbi:LemA family protein [Candidatus Uhrbacteria bacterium]|nr:LemA family protein [Candidatus Uhrbacteria bacterium]
MPTTTIVLVAILALAIMAAIWVIVTYNGLVTLRNRTDEAWSDIDVQLKRRHDLIPNLVETVKGYARHESETFEKVIRARSSAMGAQGTEAKAQAESALSQTLKSIFALAENYPDLKASQNFLQMQDDLKDTEDKIQAARRFYNANVRDFNTRIQVFPNSLIAAQLKFSKYDFFEIAGPERENIQVKF